MEPLAIPEDLSGLTDEELQALRDEATERASALDNDDTLAEITAEDAVVLMQGAIDALERIDAEQAVRDEKAEADRVLLEETRARMQARLNPKAEDENDPEPDPDPDAEADDEEIVAEEEIEVEEPAEPVLAAATRKTLPKRQKAQEPAKPEAGTLQNTIALATIPGLDSGSVEAGSNIRTKRQLAEAITDKWNRTLGTDGPRQDIAIARIKLPNSRVLRNDDEAFNTQVFKEDLSPESLTASGGLCPPAEPLYDLMQISTEQTPVINSLPSYQAARGAVRFMTPPKLSGVTTGVGIMTAANDQVGGTTATKTCQTIPCPAQVVVSISAIYHCLAFGNMGARAWPELVEDFTSLTMAAHARVRETAALDAIAANSTAVTAALVTGANGALLGEILTAAAGQRNRNRMDPDAKLRVLLPAWTREALVADLIRSQFQRFEHSIAGVAALLRTFNVEPTFYIDGATGAGQVFGAQGASTLLGFPTTVVWYLFPEGSFVRIDSGELDLGIVRDSVLNATNDFQMFGEVFENVAFRGVESLKITSQFCANGEVTLPKTQACPIVY